MRSVLSICCLAIVLQYVHSYVLLSANMADIESLTKELAGSPVVGQVKNFLRMASTQFKDQVNRARDDSSEENPGLVSNQQVVHVGKMAAKLLKDVNNVISKVPV